ncbi:MULTISPECIES: hypothetical protein [Gammaproteobacteria]|uniref:hypothetical protein n=1 Tax=Acinetobacter sp. HRXRD-152 TaxID=3404808 RepID=UPI003BB74681
MQIKINNKRATDKQRNSAAQKKTATERIGKLDLASLAEYIIKLEDRIEELERKNDKK